MTFTEKQIANYIEASINRMHKTFDWAKDKMDDYTTDRKVKWAKECIKEEYQNGYGALAFARIYLEGIEEKTFDALNRKLSDATYDLLNQVDDYFYGC